MVGNNRAMKISLRFNSFKDALDAQMALARYAHTGGGVNEGSKIKSVFFEPAPLYFDGKFSTKFEGCIKDKFSGLDSINEVRSDYVKKGLLDRG